MNEYFDADPEARRLDVPTIRRVASDSAWRYHTLKYFIDSKHRLWKGPIDNDSNFHWSVLESFGPNGPDWAMRRSNPDVGWIEITPEQAVARLERMVSKWVYEQEEDEKIRAKSDGAILFDFQGKRWCPNCMRELQPRDGKLPVHYRVVSGQIAYECMSIKEKYMSGQ